MSNINEASQYKIADRLKWLIDDYLEISRDAFAHSIDTKKSALSNWINGPGRLSLDGALKINALYGTSLDFLFLGRADTLPHNMRTAWLSRPREISSNKSSEKPEA